MKAYLLIGAAFMLCAMAKADPAIDRGAVVKWLSVQQSLHPGMDYTQGSWDKVVGVKTAYVPKDFAQYEQTLAAEPDSDIKAMQGGKSASIGKAKLPTEGFQGVKIRNTYLDVLASEDPTAGSTKKVADITGAQISYARDFQSSGSKWTAQGALILPFAWTNGDATPGPNEPFQWESFGFVPSGEVNYLDDDKDKSKDLDQVNFRVGSFVKTVGGLPGLVSQTVRLYGIYGTDTDFRSSVPSGELQWEPVVDDINGSFGIGVKKSLWRRSSNDPSHPESGQTLLGYQLRTILDLQGGSINDVPVIKGVSNGDFVRVGPKIQLRIDPIFTKRLICTISYQYLPDLVGHSNHSGFLQVQPEYFFTDPDSKGMPQASLKLSFQDGGVDLTQQKVKTFTVGLGIAF